MKIYKTFDEYWEDNWVWLNPYGEFGPDGYTKGVCEQVWNARQPEIDMWFTDWKLLNDDYIELRFLKKEIEELETVIIKLRYK